MFLNLGRLESDKWILYSGIGGLFWELASQFSILVMNGLDSANIEGVTYLAIGIVALIAGLKRSSIFETGITVSRRLMDWDKIESYVNKSNSLTVKVLFAFVMCFS